MYAMTEFITRHDDILSIVFFLCAYLIPVPLWFFRSVRRSIPAMFVTSIMVNVGMWLERYLIIVPGLAYKQELPFDWNMYAPSVFEFILVLGSFGLVSLGLLLFAKVFPIIPLYDIKEGEAYRADIEVGRTRVPASVRE
jgi:molybdopterin-containing oxidoreductase family membrane subunit